MYMTEKEPGVEYKLIAYQNSGDSRYGEKDGVVGSNALSVVNKTRQDESFNLTGQERSDLLSIARNTIVSYLRSEQIPAVEQDRLSPGLKQKAGAFVTLKKKGELRGCIGHFEADNPLYKTVQQMAVSSATQDYRFSPVSLEEMDQIEVEISVLTPMKKISSISEIRLGRDGIYIRKGNRSGTFLPQVATETGWSLGEYLGHCARDKAGIGWEGWKDSDAEIFIYEALVFHEK
jgi:AmmeMemoRadiSam system protein A